VVADEDYGKATKTLDHIHDHAGPIPGARESSDPKATAPYPANTRYAAVEIPPRGVERKQKASRKSLPTIAGDAFSDAVAAAGDSDLEELARTWPLLPPAIRAAMVAIMRAAAP